MSIFEKIRMTLIEKGEISPYEFYLETNREYKQKTVYSAFYVLRKLCLIEPVREEEQSRGLWPKVKHRIRPGMEDNDCWRYAWYCYRELRGREDQLPLFYRVTGRRPWASGLEEVRRCIEGRPIR